MSQDEENTSLAHSHIIRLKEDLRDEKFKDPKWESHRRLLDAAYHTTNGGSGDVRVMSENIGELSAFVVMRDLQSSAEHDARCPIKTHLAADNRGDVALVIDKNGQLLLLPVKRGTASRISSSLNFKLGDKEFNATGPITVLVSILVFFGAMWWLGARVGETAKSAVKTQIRQTVMELRAEENDDTSKTKGDQK